MTASADRLSAGVLWAVPFAVDHVGARRDGDSLLVTLRVAAPAQGPASPFYFASSTDPASTPGVGRTARETGTFNPCCWPTPARAAVWIGPGGWRRFRKLTGP